METAAGSAPGNGGQPERKTGEILDIALRVAVLERIGFVVNVTIKRYLLDEYLNWIRLEKHLEEDGVIPQNMLRQMLYRLQNR